MPKFSVGEPAGLRRKMPTCSKKAFTIRRRQSYSRSRMLSRLMARVEALCSRAEAEG